MASEINFRQILKGAFLTFLVNLIKDEANYFIMKYSIAYNFDKKLINYYRKINTKKDSIFQVFFSSSEGYLGGGRYRGLPKILLKRTQYHFEYLKGKMQVNYLLNSSYCPDLRYKQNRKDIMNYFSWVQTQKPAIVTVANKKILTLLRDNFPELKVNVSIVMGVKTIKQVNNLRIIYPNITRITLHQTINRDKNLLVQHVKNAKQKTKNMNPVEIELLANEICLYNCPMMKKDYLHASIKSFNKRSIISPVTLAKHNRFSNFCANKRSANPINFLNSCFIRPEDIKFYEKIGIDIIKLSGREASSDYLRLIAKAYMRRYYGENIMDLFLKQWWPDNEPPYVDNKLLDGFLMYLWKRNLKKLIEIPEQYNISWKYHQ